MQRMRTRLLSSSQSETPNMADPPYSFSLLPHRWSRDEIPLSRREGEEVLARRVGRRPRTPPSPTEVTDELKFGCS